MTNAADLFTHADSRVAVAAVGAPAGSPEMFARSVAGGQQTVAAVQPTAARKHSLFGLASFALSLFVGGGEFILVASAAIITVANPAIMNATSPLEVGLTMLMCAGIPLAVLGTALGIVGLFEKDRRKVFAVLGLILYLAIAMALGLLYIVGSQMPAAATSHMV